MITAKNDDHEIKMEPSVLPKDDDSLEENPSSGDMSTDMSLEESTTPSPVDSPIYPSRSTRNQKPGWLKYNQ